MNYAVISNKSGRDVAIIVHDEESGRIVFKGQQGDLSRSLDVVLKKPIVIQEHHGNAIIRHKVPSTSSEYLQGLVTSFVHLPYKARFLESEGSQRIDSLADHLDGQYLAQEKN